MYIIFVESTGVLHMKHLFGSTIFAWHSLQAECPAKQAEDGLRKMSRQTGQTWFSTSIPPSTCRVSTGRVAEFPKKPPWV